MARRRGSPKRKVLSVSPFFPSFQSFSLPISYTNTPRILSFRSSLVDTYTTIVSLVDTDTTILFLSLSLGSPILPPPPLIYSGICGDANLALPTRDAKNGDTTSGQMTWPRPGPATPPPADGFITSYAAHLKPIELLGERECLTQISTSEGVSATLGNWELLTGFGG